MMMDTLTKPKEGTILLDGIKRSKMYETFKIPTMEEIAKVNVGDYVKVSIIWTVGIEDREEAERFWVHIISVEGSQYQGMISGMIHYTDNHGLRDGDIIEFEAHNIISLFRDGNAPSLEEDRPDVSIRRVCKHINQAYTYLGHYQE